MFLHDIVYIRVCVYVCMHKMYMSAYMSFCMFNMCILASDSARVLANNIVYSIETRVTFLKEGIALKGDRTKQRCRTQSTVCSSFQPRV